MFASLLATACRGSRVDVQSWVLAAVHSFVHEFGLRDRWGARCQASAPSLSCGKVDDNNHGQNVAIHDKYTHTWGKKNKHSKG